jgi:hypothetical protein
MDQAFILLEGSLNHLSVEHGAKVGDTVYPVKGYDYGLARDDTYATGEEYISVTLDQNGDYPYFTVPVRLIESV